MRNFVNSYNQLENNPIGNTDFDLPSYWDDETKQFKSVTLTDEKIFEQPYVNWFENYKFNVGRVDVVGGSNPHQTAGCGQVCHSAYHGPV